MQLGVAGAILLPYSQLFAWHKIGQYLGVKWTDGTAYLLTWSGPETTPLSADFYDAYAERLAEPENPWFQYSALAHEMPQGTALLRQKKEGNAAVFPWRSEPPLPGNVDVLDGSFGGNCRGFVDSHFHGGNATAVLRKACDRKAACKFEVSTSRLGDPVGGCDKDFAVAYRCAPGENRTVAGIPPPAEGHTVTLDCKPGIHVLQASYGRSCRDFQPPPPKVNLFIEGNLTDVATLDCNGKTHCDFAAELETIDDPASGCDKDLSLKYACLPGGAPKTIRIEAPANGKPITLDCPATPG
jgi:hypothetical protein